MAGRDARDEKVDLERDLLELPDPDETAVAPSPALRETLLASVSGERPFEGFVRRVAGFLDFEPSAARELLDRAGRVESEPWVAGHLAGVRLLHFHGGARIADAHCGLVSIEPGVTYPLHRHRGDEWSFVVRGSARDDSGRVMAPGDVVHLPAGSQHSFEALGTQPFVFVLVLHDGIEHL